MIPGIVYSWSWTIPLDELEMYQFFAILSHSKSQPLFQKTCIFYIFETLARYIGVCLCTHALAHVRRPLPTYVG